jgi:hypothetical protein
MARVTVGNEGLDIHLSLADEVLSLHGSFHIPYSHIESVDARPVPFELFRGVKIGTNLPGVRTAGTFITGEGAIFYDMHDGSHCLTIGLTHERYTRVVVEVDADQDPAALAEAIRDMLPKARSR